ncbi:hypothetical protein HWV62_16888 [Athelia sp. TMB]|nr:hypothetical protein HWV62_16888 [Athelia sp. TMB]
MTGHTFNAIGTSGTVTMVAGDHTTNIDYHMYSTTERQIHTWMKALDTSPSYNAARKKHQTGTGSWFLNGSEFSAWKEGPASVLWLRGGPGCGKTILSSSVIENVVEFCELKPTARGYAYFFFDGTKAQSESLSYESLLRSIITQLSNRCGANIPDVLVDLYNKCDEGQRQPLESQLENTLSQILDIFESTYIIIDALDECAEKADFSRWIQSVTTGMLRKLHLMLTSRPEADIERGLASLRNLKTVSVGDQSMMGDIRAYLDARLRAAEMSKWNEGEKQMIKTGLSADSDVMFRWVTLQVDAIKKCKNKRELKAQLNSLPKGLDATYTQIFEQSECPDYLERLLQWLAFSRRPLTVAELAEVLAVDINTGDVPFYDPDLQCKIPAIIWSICNGFVTEFEGTVKLAHFSVKEYLIARIKHKAEAQFSTSEQFSHSVIAQDCLAQLLHFDGPSIVDWRDPGAISIRQINSLFPLAQYAAMNWACHLHICSSASTHCTRLQKLLLHLFESPADIWSHALLSWVRLQNLVINANPSLSYNFPPTVLGRRFQFTYTPDLPLDVSPLFYAFFAGSLYTVQHLICNGADVNILGLEESTSPILIASEEGHVEIVRMLLDKGANVNAEGGTYGSALQAASVGGYLEVAKLLMDKGANVNFEGGIYVSALRAASEFGHLELVKLLLDRGANVNAEGRAFGSALQAACTEGHLELAKLLLDKGANFNFKGRLYVSALQAASAFGHLELAKLLLDEGADINIEGGRYGSALQVASARGHLELSKLLLDKGANVNAKGGRYGRTALEQASRGGHVELANLLLSKGANVNLEGGEYVSVLQVASAEGHIELAKLLLAKGANVNLEGGEYGSALQAASAFGHLELVKLLLDKGANVNAKGGRFGRTALQAASINDSVAIAQLLREHGAVDLLGDLGTGMSRSRSSSLSSGYTGSASD